MMLSDYQSANDAIREKYARKALEEAQKYQSIFMNPIGEEVLNSLKSNFDHVATYSPGMNTVDTIYYEGQRSVINFINQQLTYKDNGRTDS